MSDNGAFGGPGFNGNGNAPFDGSGNPFLPNPANGGGLSPANAGGLSPSGPQAQNLGNKQDGPDHSGGSDFNGKNANG